MTNYKTIFLSNNGTNIFTTLGFLTKTEKLLEYTKYWNVSGCASLIVFLKIVGHNDYKKINDILESFSLTPTLINGSSLLPEDESEKIKYIKEWLIEHLQDSEFFSKDIRLEEIYKKTNLFPRFILWSRKEQKIVTIDPESCPRFKLIDCVMASLCYIGVYEEYSFMGNIFSNLSSVDCYPYLYSKHKEGDVLYIGNIGKYDQKQEVSLGPLSKIEDMLIRQYSEHEKNRVDNIFNTFDQEEGVKIYSFYRRGKIGKEESKTLFELGWEQGKAFEMKKDTEKTKEEYIQKVESQP
jgi:hypothetical protein